MRNILVLGAGRSATTLIEYLLNNSQKEGWKVKVGEYDLKLAESKVKNHPNGTAFFFDINNENQRAQEISNADIVISLLPASMHFLAAKECVKFSKNMVTASYVSEEIKKLDKEAREKSIIMLQETGLDPGIDHMSAMQIIEQIREEGGKLTDFESFTGGLVAPESEDDNPWGYKFTWNPRNVVVAGQGGACKFIQEGQYKYIPYHRLFRRTEIINVEGYGKFEGYANRDSLNYRSLYKLENIKTMYRGTLRRPGFCRAWDCFVQLGATDDSYTLENSEYMTYREFINTFLAYHPTDSVELKLKQYLKIDQDDVDLWHKLEWLGIFKNEKIGLKNATPAQILQHILEKKWALQPHDKDMIVMWHKFVYIMNGERIEKQSSMVCKGNDQLNTAMSKTVGLPAAIAAKHILNKSVSLKGVQIPTEKEIYEPILNELQQYGIAFTEKEFKLEVY